MAFGGLQWKPTSRDVRMGPASMGGNGGFYAVWMVCSAGLDLAHFCDLLAQMSEFHEPRGYLCGSGQNGSSPGVGPPSSGKRPQQAVRLSGA